jgi:hypothetical protein
MRRVEPEEHRELCTAAGFAPAIIIIRLAA